MTRGLAVVLSSLVLSAGADSQQAPSPWQYNPRERTDSAIESQREGDLEQANEAFGAALGLSPGDPLLQFNAGTAALMGSSPEAVDQLQAAAQGASEELKPAALYNLGNAHLAGEDFSAAIDAFKESLRLTPESADAKHNLEIALRKLQQQQQEQQQEPEQEQQQDSSEQPEPKSSPEQDDSEQQQDPDQPQQNPSESRLPDFEEQPDMTAEQAAAILEAVENLEREQRRKQAMEQLKRAKGDRDW